WPSLFLPPTIAILIRCVFLFRNLFPSGDSMEAGYSSNLRFPIGEHAIVEHFDRAEVDSAIEEISVFPGRIRKRVEGLSEASLEKRYRPDGWTVRQVLHHLHDSHTNCYIRFKWALTEDKPMIKAYFEDRWAELADSKSGPIE